VQNKKINQRKSVPYTVSDISLARNPVSHISLDEKSGAKSLMHGGLKFHVPVKLS